MSPTTVTPKSIIETQRGSGLPLEGVSARGRLEGLLFELSVEQRYRNDSDRVIEAVLTFPVPVRAVLLELELQLGERRLEAVAVAREQATERYEHAIDAGDAAVLLESVGNGLYTVSVGNLLPGEAAVIRYRHAEVLDANRGYLRLQVPTVIAPRYRDPAAGGLEGPAIPQVDPLIEYPFEIEIDLVGVASSEGLQSPTHPIRVQRTELGTNVSLSKSSTLDRDFVLEIARAHVPHPVLIARDGEEWVGIASAVLEDIPAEQRALALAVILDCSGSMQGDSIDAARRAVGRVLETLNAEDSIGLLRFGSETQWVTQGLEACSAARLSLLRASVRRIEADLGGTELARAMTEALKAPLPEGRVGDLLLVTDGQVQELENLVHLVAHARRRLFVVAVGAAPNEALARRLSEHTGGACEFVASGELAEDAIVRMFRRLRAEPRIVREIAWPASAIWELPPPSAVFPDETVHLIAGFAVRPSGSVYVRVGTAEGQVRVVQLPVAAQESGSTALARVAAARRLSTLPTTEATALALRHQIASNLTSFVVIAERSEADKAAGTIPATVPVRQMLAAGWGGTGTLSRVVGQAAYPFGSASYRLSAPRLRAGVALGSPALHDEQPSPDLEVPLHEQRSWREILQNLSTLAPVTSVLALSHAGLHSATVHQLVALMKDLVCSELALVDAVIEVMIELAGSDSEEAKAVRKIWTPRRSLFSGRSNRRLRRGVRGMLRRPSVSHNG